MKEPLNAPIQKLAKRRRALAAFQADAERLMELCESAEIECEHLAIEIGCQAVAIGEDHPHPAVTVVCTDGVPRVEIARDLSEYAPTPAAPAWLTDIGEYPIRDDEMTPGLDAFNDHCR